MLHILLKTPTQHTDIMNKRRPYEDFTCPKCSAEYKLVRMPAPVESRDRPLQCKICKHELASADGENILKYFLVGRNRRSRPKTLTTAH